jgi:non-ribosomal peptide synthetase component F
MDYAGATQGFTIPAELVDRLRSLGGQETATLFMVILTGLNVLLSRWSGQRDIVIGTPTVGRSRPELWGLLGFFNNTIALRSDLTGDVSFRDLLRRVRAVVLGGMEHQEIPFDRVVREVAPDRDPSRNPIFDVMYVHQTLPPDFSFGDSTFNPGRPDGAEEETPLFPGLPPGTAKFDLTFVVAERPDVDELEVALEYSTQLFDAETITAMSRALIDLLWAAAEDADVNHRQLPAQPPVREDREAASGGQQRGQGEPAVPGGQELPGERELPGGQDMLSGQEPPSGQAVPGGQDGIGSQLAYWQHQLTALKPADLPTDRPRPLHGTHASARHRLRVPQDVAAGLARDGGTRERLLAGIAALLGFRAGADEVVLGLAETSPEIRSGPLALRIDTAGGPTLDGLAVRVREVLAGAAAHADVTYDEVVQELRLPQQPGRAPLFDVTYAHHVLPPDLGTAAGVDVRADMGGHDLAWTVLEGPRPGEVSVSVEYRTELFEAATVAAMAEDLVTLLRLGLHEPGVPLDVLWLADAPTRTAGPGPEPYGR